VASLDGPGDHPPWIVQIVGQRIGAGMLVSDAHVLTCAHVVGTSPPALSLQITFPFLGATWTESAEVVSFEAPPGDDVAVLRLVGVLHAASMPSGARAAPFARA
jgi:hypothetical protein